MTYYLTIVFVLYFLILVALMIGWSRATRCLSVTEKNRSFISIVVAARNEEKNIRNLLNAILELNYDRNSFEVIVVDDGSDDKTFQVSNDFFENNKIGRAMRLTGGTGKKAALTFGISHAKGTVIATTDADCIVPPEWLQGVNRMFQNEDLHLCVGAVKIISDGKIFSSLQAMEFASVIGVGASTLGWGKSTMCNGANLSFRKEEFEEVNGYEGNFSFASGDDQFLMAKINNLYRDGVSFMPFRESVVSTAPLSSLSSFISQRIRWAGKWSAMSGLSKMLAVFTFVIQFSWLLLIVHFFVDPRWASVLIIFKVSLEFVFLSKVHRFLSLVFRPISFLLLQFIYAPYVIGTAILAQFNTFMWKGRRHAG